ncbi:50S ribosomal protein L4 [Patescibacteria group bacterium]|nr:MAG: 50S ribosomal protein L4 [Patescibacteria group bacterium]
MKTPIYDIKSKAVGEIELPESIFGAKRNDVLLNQVILAMRANARTPVAHTKGRGEVRGGGKKPWKQKGTGRARHGSTRSPIWRGGGTTHGPLKERDFSQKINKKTRSKALAIALSDKFRSGKMIFVNELPFKLPKTKDAKAALIGLSKVKGFEELAVRRNNAALILTGGHHQALVKSFNNMSNVLVDEVRNANPLDIMKYRYVLVVEPEASVKVLASRIEK